jgi:hypothetical protein
MSERSLMLLTVLALTSPILGGCTRGDDAAGGPKDRLHRYISRTFDLKSVSERKELEEFLTGEARTRLAAWNDEQFREAFIESKRQFVKLAWREIKNTSPAEVNITYELTYIDQGKGKDAKVTNRKICQLVQHDGKWLIADVRNIKEMIEYRNEMSLP